MLASGRGLVGPTYDNSIREVHMHACHCVGAQGLEFIKVHKFGMLSLTFVRAHEPRITGSL
jgi:hypothetical protein